MGQRKWVELLGGGYALPFRLEFLLTSNDIARILAYSRRDWPHEKVPLLDMTRQAMDRRIQDTLRSAGWENIQYWHDNVAEEDQLVIWAWAVRQVERTYGSATA